MCTAILSLSRILALWKYYHAPMTVFFQFETMELPRLLYASGRLPPVPPNMQKEEIPRVDLSLVKVFELRLCTGKEWHRFPGHYLVPDGVRVDFVKSEFDGLLPGHFGESHNQKRDHLGKKWWLRDETTHIPEGLNDVNREETSHYVRFHVFRCFTVIADMFRRFPLRHATFLLIWIFHSIPRHPHSNHVTRLTPNLGTACRAYRS
jgi:alpha-1,2-mannosyltransferase